MSIEQIVNLLRERGCSIARSQVNAGGRFVHLVQPWDVAMFHDDIDDILAGRATLTEVVSRNTGADLADPWPVGTTFRARLTAGGVRQTMTRGGAPVRTRTWSRSFIRSRPT